MTNFLPKHVFEGMVELYEYSSVLTYQASIKRAHVLLYGEHAKYDIKRLLKDQDILIDIFADDDRIPLSSKKTMMNAISALINFLEINTILSHKFLDYVTTARLVIDDERSFDKKEQPKSRDEIVDIINSTYNRLSDMQKPDKFNPKVDIPHVVLALLKYLPPLRSQDYIYLNYNDYDDTSNYVDLEAKSLVIRTYKTNKTHGTRIIHMPEELFDVIDRMKDVSGSDWVIPSLTNPDKTFSPSSFNKLLNSLLGAGISTTVLRRLYVSEIVINNDMKGKERKKIAKIMGHTTRTQNEMYSSYSKLAD